MLRSLLAALSVVVVLSSGLVLVDASAAHAESVNVSASCAGLTVKSNGFASKGEARVVVDGEVQTDGTDDGWRSFSSSFTAVYAFDPTVSHSYRVDINSFGSDSAGRAFAAGTGYDSTSRGPTVACDPVLIAATSSNCVSLTAAPKQSIDLTLSSLRRSVTYLAEVLDSEGTVVKHFQFRTAPVVSKIFSGLEAGETYLVRVSDQADDTLSSQRFVSIAGCAAKVALSPSVSQCSAPGGSRALTVRLDGLVRGRDYSVSTVPGSVRDTSFTATGSTKTIEFADLTVGRSYAVSVVDDDAPRRTTSEALLVDACVSPGASSGGSATSSSSGAQMQHSRAGASGTATSSVTGVENPASLTGSGTGGTAAQSGGQLDTLALQADESVTPALRASALPFVWLAGAVAAVMMLIAAIVIMKRRRRTE